MAGPMVQPHGCLHLVPPLPARAATAVPFLTAILQQRGIVQPEPVVPGCSPRRFHQRIPLKRVCCSCLSPLWHAAIVRPSWAGVNETLPPPHLHHVRAAGSADEPARPVTGIVEWTGHGSERVSGSRGW